MSGVALMRYDAARHALAEAHHVDEVKDIRDKAVAMQAYAKQAKDTELIDHATDIRVRAEIRVGELLSEMEKAKRGPDKEGKPQRSQRATSDAATLADLGVTKTQSSRWQKLAALSADEQESKIARAKKIAVAVTEGDREVLQAAKAEGQQIKRDRREARERELAAATVAASQALGSKLYGVIYADPPWRFEAYSEDSGNDRIPGNHYPTMLTKDIAAVRVPAAKDAALFLWATAAMLTDALEVMTAWGFGYKAHAVWNKDKIGLGYWFRSKHELLLVGVRGDIPAPANGTQWPSVIDAPRGEHSEKPTNFAKMIEELFPNLPKLEMFARVARPGWDAWGNEAPQVLEAAQ
jgi:N6-adenosine-specific RNA methylase IME4